MLWVVLRPKRKKPMTPELPMMRQSAQERWSFAQEAGIVVAKIGLFAHDLFRETGRHLVRRSCGTAPTKGAELIRGLRAMKGAMRSGASTTPAKTLDICPVDAGQITRNWFARSYRAENGGT